MIQKMGLRSEDILYSFIVIAAPSPDPYKHISKLSLGQIYDL